MVRSSLLTERNEEGRTLHLCVEDNMNETPESNETIRGGRIAVQPLSRLRLGSNERRDTLPEAEGHMRFCGVGIDQLYGRNGYGLERGERRGWRDLEREKRGGGRGDRNEGCCRWFLTLSLRANREKPKKSSSGSSPPWENDMDP